MGVIINLSTSCLCLQDKQCHSNGDIHAFNCMLIQEHVSDCALHMWMTYVQVLEQGGGPAGPHRHGGTATLIDATISPCQE